jgi:hypothetical protein
MGYEKYAVGQGAEPHVKKVLEHNTHKTHTHTQHARKFHTFIYAPLLSLCRAIEETNALRLLHVAAKLVFV